MPIYEYNCLNCGSEFEMMRSFSDSSSPACPTCASTNVQRQLSRPAIHFKGSGWYINDSKSSTNGKNGAEAKKEEATPSDSAAKEGSTTSDTSSKSASDSTTKETPKESPKESATKEAPSKTPAATS